MLSRKHHVQDALAAHLAECGPSREGYLFSTVTQGKVSQNSYRVRAFKPAVAKAGLPVGTRPHDLRHHFASMLVSDGMPAVLVADLLGHTTATLVLSTYGHLMPSEEDHKRKAMQHA
jgi:integrase